MKKNWLNAGWPIFRIRDIGRLHGGGTPSRKRAEFFQGTIPWITGQDIPESHVAEISAARDYVTDEAVQESATRIVPAGAVLVTTRVSVGKTAIAGCPICFSQDVTAILIHSDAIALPAYVAYFLRSRREALLQKNQGSTISGITRDSLALEPIPLPPLSEQQRIVEILQEAEEIRRLRAEAEVKSNELIPATFFKFFGNAEQHFKNVPLRDLVDEFRYGTSQSSGDRGSVTLRIPNILGDRISFDDLVNVDENEDSLKRLRLQTGDMLFVRTNGNPDYIGRCCVFDQMDAERQAVPNTPIIYASYLIRARLKLDMIRPWFLHAYLRSSLGRARILKQARTAAGQYNINTEGLGAIRVPVPTLELQDKFLLEANETQQIIEMSRGSKKQLAALVNSLSALAFSGQLTATWREANKITLQHEAHSRDITLQEAVGISSRQTFVQIHSPVVKVHQVPTKGNYSQLNREQYQLLDTIGRFVAAEDAGYFTADLLAREAEEPLRHHPQRIEAHLKVFSARGIILAVSRPRTDSTGPSFAACYRLPVLSQRQPQSNKDSEQKESDDIKTMLLGMLRSLVGERN